jgi:hypothetical protein
MAAQRDLQAQNGRLQQEHEATGQEVIFYPKFHCELNFIEHFWCSCKTYTRVTALLQCKDYEKSSPKPINYDIAIVVCIHLL